MLFTFQNFISEDLVHHMVHQVLQNPEGVIRSKVQVLPLLIALGGCELQHLNQRQALDVLVDHEQIRIKEVLLYSFVLFCISMFYAFQFIFTIGTLYF